MKKHREKLTILNVDTTDRLYSSRRSSLTLPLILCAMCHKFVSAIMHTRYMGRAWFLSAHLPLNALRDGNSFHVPSSWACTEVTRVPLDVW